MPTNLNLVNEILNEILTCACDTLLNGICDEPGSQCKCPCRLFVTVGQPVWDMEACCGDGQLSVHSPRIFPFGNFPQQDSQVNICQTPLAAEIVVTLLRCFPTVRDDGSAPIGPEIQTASETIYRDQYLLTRGLLCCLAGPGRKRKFVFQDSRPVGPNAGCAGVELRFIIELMEI